MAQEEHARCARAIVAAARPPLSGRGGEGGRGGSSQGDRGGVAHGGGFLGGGALGGGRGQLGRGRDIYDIAAAAHKEGYQNITNGVESKSD